ncbi:MAG: hypothetical protein K2Q06_00905, partial [Parvularculaceae bacterium]|nr:hypothetical protein [Parvularculaceae bacterium]
MAALRRLAALALAASSLTSVASAAAGAGAGAVPKDAATWSILSASGQHGQERVWTTKDGVRHAKMNILLRGLVFDVTSAMTLGADGRPTKVTIAGSTPSGDAGETFAVENGVARWKTPVDSGEAPWRGDLVYIPYGGPNDTLAVLVDAALKDADKKFDALPGGAARITDLVSKEFSANGKTKTLKAVLIEGLGFSPSPVWIDENNRFFAVAGGLSWLPKGWEPIRADLVKAQEEAMAARAPAERARLLKDPGAPVLYRNVTIYDAAANGFAPGMSVLVDGAKIAAVGPAKKVKAPKGAVVIEGAGKTLVPGLWDMHHHYGDDSQGPLDLAQGVTSVRDVGNDRTQLLARKKRIDDGALLGPKIYPILGIDGDGPLSAQSFVRIKSVEEGVAAIERGKNEGFYGIKLYGTINPAWVAPLAVEAHKRGMSVQGHVPAGMRPSEAVAAGYDGINHINFVVMDAMPDDVVKTSNGLNRFFGPGRYAKDVDLSKPPMAPFIETLAAKKIVIDPTLTVYEGSFMYDQGEIAQANAPYLGTYPAQIERGFRGGGFVAPPEFKTTRADMRASFKKLVELG